MRSQRFAGPIDDDLQPARCLLAAPLSRRGISLLALEGREHQTFPLLFRLNRLDDVSFDGSGLNRFGQNRGVGLRLGLEVRGFLSNVDEHFGLRVEHRFDVRLRQDGFGRSVDRRRTGFRGRRRSGRYRRNGDEIHFDRARGLLACASGEGLAYEDHARNADMQDQRSERRDDPALSGLRRPCMCIASTQALRRR